MFRILSSIAMSVAMTPPLCLSQAADTRNIVDASVKPYLDKQPNASVVVGLLLPGDREVYSYGKVELDRAQRTPDGKTIYEIGSVTKAFIGVLLAALVLEEKVALDDPAAKHLPDRLRPPEYENQQMTLAHLATHRSGLPEQPPRIALFALAAGTPQNPYSRYTQEELAKMLAELRLTLPIGWKLRLTRPIGSKQVYSSLGVGLLGHALTHAAGAESYEQLVVEESAPLEMNDTRITLNDELRERFAPGHNAAGKPISALDWASLEGAGALRSTCDDMLTFADANLGRVETTLLPALRLSHEERADASTPARRFGLCRERSKHRSGEYDLIFHDGKTFGYRSFLGLLPPKNIGIVVLANSAVSVNSIAFTVLEQLLAREP